MAFFNYSNPSLPIFSLKVPKVQNSVASFTYNFYVTDEGTNDASTELAEAEKVLNLINKSPDQINPDNTSFSLRIPRYVTISWDPVPNGPDQSDLSNIDSGFKFLDSSIFDKKAKLGFLSDATLPSIVTEDQFVSSKYYPYSFSCLDKIRNASQIIAPEKGDFYGYSQSGIIDKYTTSILAPLSNPSDSNTNQQALRDQVAQFVSNVEIMGDNTSSNLGWHFFDSQNMEITNTSGLDQALADEVILESQVSGLTLPDNFDASSLNVHIVNSLNLYYNNAKAAVPYAPSALDDANLNIQPIFTGAEVNSVTPINHDDFMAKVAILGYIIEKYEISDDGTNIKKIKNLYFNNKSIHKFVDLNVKYGTRYAYSIRTVAAVRVPAYIKKDEKIRYATYYVSSRSSSATVSCIENIPPPPPTDVEFIWDYYNTQLNIVWQMPENPQRDTKQFQIFRRESIDKPFELLQQQSFDNSTKKFLTGEAIDGNLTTMSKSDARYVVTQAYPMMNYIDPDFVADIEYFKTSKYIYSLASVDAHGNISSYGIQFEVYFDFFKNRLIKKIISPSGAPRQYPNLYIDVDLFKDVIQADGPSAKKLKIYFMPDYFKLRYPEYTDNNNNKFSEKESLMVGTLQNNSYYKMQFINTQNQKTDSLQINIGDPNNFVN